MVWTRNQEKELESASAEKKQLCSTTMRRIIKGNSESILRQTKRKHNLPTLMGYGKSSSEEFLQW